MEGINKRVFRLLACCELMQRDHYYTVRSKRGESVRLVKGDRLRFLTLTVPESGLSLRTVARRFRSFSNSRWWRDLMRFHSYICVYEPHPSGHGWHIHILTNVFIPVQELDIVSRSYLFGHSHIESAESDCAFYIAKYVCKTTAVRALSDRHVRIVNVSRDLLPLRDVLSFSPSLDFIRDHWEDSTLPQFRRLVYLYYLWVFSWSGFFLLPRPCSDERSFALNVNGFGSRSFL